MTVHDFPGSASSPIPITATDASLQTIADELVDRYLDGAIEPALVSVARVDSDGYDLYVKALEGEHPSAFLLGNDAPESFTSIGVITGGRAWHLDDPDRAGPVGVDRDDRPRAAVSMIVSRSGEVASCMQVDGRDRASGGEGVVGLIVDQLRRALGLPTDPPPCGTNVLFAIYWLAAIVDAHERGTLDPTWRDLTELHPAVTLLERGRTDDDDGEHDDPGAADFIDVAGAHARVLTWSFLRELVDLDRFEVPGLVGGDGAWFDDGSFARHLLSELPPLRVARRQARSRLPRNVYRRVASALRALDVPDRTWPDVLDAA